MDAIIDGTAQADLNDVALFVRVVRASSFSAAAKERGVPVSTVSRRIARLETRLSARLLERTTRKLHLTDVGRRYFAHAERALDELSEGSNYVRALSTVPRGRVRVTAPIAMGPMVTRAVAPYLDANPNVVIEIDLTERRVDLLAEGFDIAIGAGGDFDSADFVARKLRDSTRYLYASKEYLDRRGRPKKIADLSSHDLIAMGSTTSGTSSWNLRVGNRLHRHAFKPRLSVNELAASRSAAEAGIGIVLLPSVIPAVKNDDEGDHSLLALERVLPNVAGEKGGLFLLYPARRSLTAAVRSCVDHLLVALATRFPH